jgi:uncharacterized membrane protein YraQ (UPF0718 family)
MVDLGSLGTITSIFGASTAVLYVVLGLVVAILGGSLIEKLHMEPHIESFVLQAGSVDIESPELTTQDRAWFTP